LRNTAREAWSRPLTSSATFWRSSTPIASINWKATPRAMPVMSSAAASANNGASSRSM
jgi:hypothetical protein